MCGIEADEKKAERIVNWPIPKSATETRSFLGLVQYLADFLPVLAEYTGILTELTTTASEKKFPAWTDVYQKAFDSIKQIVVERECLTMIDLMKLPKYKIFVTTDASNQRSGAVLSFGKTWSSARPMAFDSMMFKGAELNYPVHEKELLAIIHALKKWCVDLLGSLFFIYTDHKTLENFNTQKKLSRRQARWMELMSQYDASIVYIKGEENSMVDALSRLPCEDAHDEAIRHAWHPYSYCEDDNNHIAVVWSNDDNSALTAATSLSSGPDICSINTTLSITVDKQLLQQIKEGYIADPWCKKLPSVMPSWPELQQINGLWYVGDRLIIPHTGSLRETLFQLVHDTLGHFGFDKTYGSLRSAYYWPNMHWDLKKGYVASCLKCQWNKSSTPKPIGPLHLLPIPDQCGDSVAIDFIGPLPEDDGNNCIITFTDHLRSDIQLVATRTDISTEKLA